MMTIIDLLEKDRAKRPDLFWLVGPIPAEQLHAWLMQHSLGVPDDLKQLWSQTGGGEMFETETLLSPFGRAGFGADVMGVNQFHRQKGMPTGLLIIHEGLGGLTAIDTASDKYVSVQPGSYEVRKTFGSLADWYANFIRPEYASRYGLS